MLNFLTSCACDDLLDFRFCFTSQAHCASGNVAAFFPTHQLVGVETSLLQLSFAFHTLNEGVLRFILFTFVISKHFVKLFVCNVFDPTTLATSKAKALHPFSNHSMKQICFASYWEIFQRLSGICVICIRAATTKYWHLTKPICLPTFLLLHFVFPSCIHLL